MPVVTGWSTLLVNRKSGFAKTRGLGGERSSGFGQLPVPTTWRLAGRVSLLWLCLNVPVAARAQPDADGADRIKQVVLAAFAATHNGWSSDEVILQDELNDRFVTRCRQELPDTEPARLNGTLMNLRKAGLLEASTTRRDPRSTASCSHIGEMCARLLMDRHAVSIDRIMADPELRAEFDDAARAIDQQVDPYLVRKAAFQLRKSRRLRPELITRIADWGRVVTTHNARTLIDDPNQIPDGPGIYLFRDASGYLYVGEAASLRKRLTQHLSDSDRAALGNYLASQGAANITVEIHSFDPDSRMREIRVRRAYESELIRSRHSRFNVRP